jgi:hypothetical protein
MRKTHGWPTIVVFYGQMVRVFGPFWLPVLAAKRAGMNLANFIFHFSHFIFSGAGQVIGTLQSIITGVHFVVLHDEG